MQNKGKKIVFVLGAILGLFLAYWPAKVMAACNYAVGESVQANWKGRWYPAEVIATGRSCRIHYAGFSNSWDEWVSNSRLQTVGESNRVSNRNQEDRSHSLGQNVEVEWKGSWYEAEVIGFGANCTQIHYAGYSNSWDECVGSRRIRFK